MHRRVTLLVLLFLVGSTAATSVDDVQKRADAMMKWARELSDIRSENAPAFRLKASFSYIDDNLETVQGTYTEIWVSKSRWRTETVVNDFRRVEIGGPNRLWRSDSGKDFPAQAARVPDLMEVFPVRYAVFEFESITDRSPQDAATACAITKSVGEQQRRSAFCFNKQNGVLVEKVVPETLRIRAADYACQYGSFRSFGHYSFPREMACFVDTHRKMDAKIVELSAEPSPDPAMFVAPAGYIEWGNCSVRPEAPQPVSTPSPAYPFGSRDRGSQVALRLRVDANGKAQDVQVARTGGKSFDEEAVRTVKGWKFKPATCEGQPMAYQITVEVRFRSYR